MTKQVFDQIAEGLREALELARVDAHALGTAIVRVNPDGTATRIDPLDFYENQERSQLRKRPRR